MYSTTVTFIKAVPVTAVSGHNAEQQHLRTSLIQVLQHAQDGDITQLSFEAKTKSGDSAAFQQAPYRCAQLNFPYPAIPLAKTQCSG